MIVLRKYRSIFSVTSKSAITPSLSGRMAMMPSVVAQHPLGLEPDALDLARTPLHRHDRGLVEDDPFALDVDEGIGRAKIDSDLVRRGENSET